MANPHTIVTQTFDPIPHVKTILAIASGKGGVGKSTVAANIALALYRQGHRVGILDADIYGPSQHIMLGLQDQKPEMASDQKIIPSEKYGIKLMSIGFFVKPEDAIIWRGPMVSRMIQQFLNNVAWGELDCLVVDLPPGTGDSQLTLTQTIPLTGVVIISTPQDIALADAVKGANMFKQVNVPVIGLIENMSYFECPKCSHHSYIFAKNGAKAKAPELGIAFLGELPLEEATRACGDAGNPIVVKEPDGEQARRFMDIATKVWASLEKRSEQDRAAFFARQEQQTPHAHGTPHGHTHTHTQDGFEV